MDRHYIKINNKRGLIVSDSDGFIELRINKKTYKSSDEFYKDFSGAVLTSKNENLIDILLNTGFDVNKSVRKRVPWRLFIEPIMLDKIDEFVMSNYPLNRSDVVNLAIAKTLPTVKKGYMSPRGGQKENVCFNIEKEFADKITAMAVTDTRNSILLACIYEYFK